MVIASNPCILASTPSAIAISTSLSRRRWQSRLANHPVESRHLVDHPAEVCHVTEEVCRLPAHPVEVRHVADHSVEVRRLPAHPVEVRHVADHRAEIRHVAGRAAEVCRLADHPVELRGLTVEMRRLADYLADFAADVGSSCLYSLGTVSMYSFFLFSFTRQLESPFTCHQIVSNGSLQATRVQSSAAATPNGRMRIGEDEGVPERKVHTQSLQ
ncbi:hypothetical protein BLSTO_05197 [Blastocystis sp. subtype 1]